MTWPGPEATPPKVPQLLLLPHAQVQVKLTSTTTDPILTPQKGLGGSTVLQAAPSVAWGYGFAPFYRLTHVYVHVVVL